jgi:aminomuconate-semialdehyde/2-hydroxymuconate-6-semialdehyde dehydrogenase
MKNTTDIENYIDGQFLASKSGKTLDNYNPSTGKIYGTIPDSNSDDIDLAVAAAKKAFPIWSGMTPKERADKMRALANLIKENAEELAIAESRDNGKPISLSSVVDIPRSSLNIEFFADAATQFVTESYHSKVGGTTSLNYTTRNPLGPVAIISPWNLPLYLLTWKVAPALAAGNTVVAKPSEVTPQTAFLFSQLIDQAGIPAGVLNIVHGTGAGVGDALSTHKDIKAVSFTGSTATGKAISKVTAGMFRKVSLEMGGKNPNIIFADCDYEKALSTTIRSSFVNQGQVCLCGSRIFIQEEIYEKLKTDLIDKAKTITQGDPLDKATKQGAVVSKPHLDKILSYFALAIEEGGKILLGGERAQMEGELAEGYFVKPTIIEGLSNTCRTNQEEIFGPVVTLQSFKNEEEVLELANGTPYGLSASVWTQDISRAHRMANGIDSGVVWVNAWMNRDLRTPFGGMKSSGMGREGGQEVLRFYTEVKNICLEY